MSRALVVVPTYNEHDTIAEAISGALATPGVDVLVVDDGSPDGTGTLVQAIADDDERVHVIHRADKQGLGSAYRRGFGWGLERPYEVFVSMDGDLSHDPSVLPELLDRSQTADLVLGSRYVEGGRTRNWAWHRRLLSRWGNRYVNLVTRVPVADATSGYRAYRRALLDELDVATVRSEGYSFQLEMLLRAWRAGFTLAEVPITFVERRSGASKISRAIVFEAVWRVLVWGFSNRRVANRHPRSVGDAREVG